MPRSTFIEMPANGAFTVGLCLVVALLHTLSPMALAELGYSYEDAGGNPLEKMHPATLVAGGLLFIGMLASQQPVSWAVALARRYPGLMFHVVATLALMAYSTRVLKLPFTGPIDTLLLPAAVFLLLQSASPQRLAILANAIHLAMFVNAVIGIAEFAFGERLVPFTAGGVPVEDDWRSTALIGHPLANSSVTAAYLLCLAMGGAVTLPRLLLAGQVIVCTSALAVFGGRAATVLLVAILALGALYKLPVVVQRGLVDRRLLVAVAIAVPVIAAAVAMLASWQFFDRFLERFIDDGGSAESRIVMFELFRDLTWHDVMFGPDADFIASRQRMLGIEFGIESFWIGFILIYGFFISIPIWIGLALFSWEIWRRTAPSSAWVLLFFFLIASTSVSLTAKGISLALVVLHVLVLLDPGLLARAAGQRHVAVRLPRLAEPEPKAASIVMTDVSRYGSRRRPRLEVG